MLLTNLTKQIYCNCLIIGWERLRPVAVIRYSFYLRKVRISYARILWVWRAIRWTLAAGLHWKIPNASACSCCTVCHTTHSLQNVINDSMPHNRWFTATFFTQNDCLLNLVSENSTDFFLDIDMSPHKQTQKKQTSFHYNRNQTTCQLVCVCVCMCVHGRASPLFQVW